MKKGKQLFRLIKKKEGFYESTSKHFIEYNKTKNFILCFRQFYNNIGKKWLDNKKKQTCNQKNLYKVICILCVMLFIHGCRKPIPVLSLFLSSGQRKSVLVLELASEYIPTRFYSHQGSGVLWLCQETRGKKIPKRTVPVQQREGKAVYFLWPCVIQIQNDSFLLSRDKFKKLAHFLLLQALVSTSAKPSKEFALKEILQQTA